jgi:hypothetical protein
MLMTRLIEEIQGRSDLPMLTTKDLISMLVSLSRLRIAMARANTDLSEESCVSGNEPREGGDELDSISATLLDQVLARRQYGD